MGSVLLTKRVLVRNMLVMEERMLLIALGLLETCYILEGESAYILKWDQWVQYYTGNNDWLEQS